MDPINTAPLQKFIQQTKAADAGRAKEVKMSLAEAKDLAFTLGIAISRLHGDLEKFVAENSSSGIDDIEVKIDGQSWN